MSPNLFYGKHRQSVSPCVEFCNKTQRRWAKASLPGLDMVLLRTKPESLRQAKIGSHTMVTEHVEKTLIQYIDGDWGSHTSWLSFYRRYAKIFFLASDGPIEIDSVSWAAWRSRLVDTLW